MIKLSTADKGVAPEREWKAGQGMGGDAGCRNTGPAHVPKCRISKVLLYDFLNIFRMDLYGFNRIEVEIKSYWTLFVEEVINPFYFFQVFSVILWMIDEYVSYSVCVIILTLFSSITSLIQTRKVNKFEFIFCMISIGIFTSMI